MTIGCKQASLNWVLVGIILGGGIVVLVPYGMIGYDARAEIIHFLAQALMEKLFPNQTMGLSYLPPQQPDLMLEQPSLPSQTVTLPIASSVSDDDPSVSQNQIVVEPTTPVLPTASPTAVKVEVQPASESLEMAPKVMIPIHGEPQSLGTKREALQTALKPTQKLVPSPDLDVNPHDNDTDDELRVFLTQGKYHRRNSSQRSTLQAQAVNNSVESAKNYDIADIQLSPYRTLRDNEFINNWSMIQAQERSGFSVSEQAAINSFRLTPNTTTSAYINPPKQVANEKVNPFTTTIPVNDLVVTHLTDWELSGALITGEQTSSDPDFNGIFKINGQVIESLDKNKVFTVDQRGEYVQLRTVRDYRKITTTQITPVTIIGQRVQISLVGDCIFGENTPQGSICTYTPGLSTDVNSIDPKTQLPTRIYTTSQFGEIVTPESLAEMKKPGFQGGANGQEIGLNLFFPNSGVTTGNSQLTNTTLTRKEELQNAAAASYLRTRQIIQANSEKSVLARTVRGLPLIEDENDTIFNSVLTLINAFLPDIYPDLEASNPDTQSNSSANRNLFFAANNTRLPPLSFVIYQAGLGEALNTPKGITDLNQIPPAFFNSIWLGLSPVIDRRSDVIQGGYDIIKPISVVESGGVEGGSTENIDFSSVLRQNSFSNQTLTSSYTQVYLSFYQQEANVVVQNIYDEETHYYPHLSFTGNITNNNSALRYYAGVIAANEIKPYLGLDYTQNLSNWNYRLGAIAYANPDRDYYSQVNGFINYKVPLDDKALLSLYSGIEYALQKYTRVGDTISVIPLSSWSMGFRLNSEGTTLGITNFWGLDNLANNSNSKMLINFVTNLSEGLSVNGYLAPYDNNSSKTQYGLNLTWNLGQDYNTPQLSFGWANYQYNYGVDALGNNRSLSDNIFTLTFRIGQPNNPFRQPKPPRS